MRRLRDNIFARALTLARHRVQLFAGDAIGSSFWLPSGSEAPVTITAPGSRWQPLLSRAAEGFPGMLRVCARYSKLYKRLKPTLMLPGGLPAVLATAPELAANMDAWMAANGVSELMPLAAQIFLQTGCVRACVRCDEMCRC